VLFIIKFMCDVTRGPTGKLIRAGMPRSRILSRFWHLGGTWGLGMGGRPGGGLPVRSLARPGGRGAGRRARARTGTRSDPPRAAAGRGGRAHTVHTARRQSHGDKGDNSIFVFRGASRAWLNLPCMGWSGVVTCRATAREFTARACRHVHGAYRVLGA